MHHPHIGPSAFYPAPHANMYRTFFAPVIARGSWGGMRREWGPCFVTASGFANCVCTGCILSMALRFAIDERVKVLLVPSWNILSLEYLLFVFYGRTKMREITRYRYRDRHANNCMLLIHFLHWQRSICF